MINISFIGDFNVGCSSILNRYLDNDFNDSSDELKIPEFRIKTIKYNTIYFCDHHRDPLERFTELSFNKKDDAIILVFDLTEKQSFDKIILFLEDSLRQIEKVKHLPILLLGNKCDQKSDIKKEYIYDFTIKNKISYIEVSSKENINIKESLDSFLNYVIDHYKNYYYTANSDNMCKIM